MNWTKEDLAYLRSLRGVVDSDNIKIKEQIKQELATNKYIAHVLHNIELEDMNASPDEYFNVNIFPYYIISPTQHNVNHFICYETSFTELDRYNRTEKYMDIYFYILCHEKDAIDSETGLARHDLLAALITDQFNWTNLFGKKVHLVEDKAGVTDEDYASRTLIFQQVTDNTLVKTKNNISRLANKDVVV